MTYSVPTSIFRIDPQNIDSHLIALAADILRAGGLVAFPHRNGLWAGANALNAAAVDKVFAAKGRPATDPLIVHVNTPSQFQQVAADIPRIAHTLADAFWPGPLTMVLKKQPVVPDNVTAGRNTVAVRMPSHPIALELLDTLGLPIAAPSANRFGHTSPTLAEHVLADLGGHIDVIFDGGATTIGLESTVLDLSGDLPVLLRPGGVALEALQEFLPALVFRPRTVTEQEAAPAPGMAARHYAPDAELLLYSGDTEPVITRMELEARERIANGQRVGVLVPNDEAGRFTDERVSVVTLGENLSEIAANLFAGMRRLDSEKMDVILVHGFSREGLGLAIWDRLLRAAEGRVIEI